MKKLTILATILLSCSSAYTMQSRLFANVKRAGFAIAGLSAYLYSNKPTPAYAIEADQPKLFEKQRGNPDHLKKLEETGECTGCDLRDFNITKAYNTYRDTQKHATRAPINVSNSNLAGANLAKGWYPKGNFENANLTNANLENGVFPFCNFTKTNLTKANLKGADIPTSDFSSSILAGAVLESAILKMSRNPFLTQVKNFHTIFTNADITDANFKNVRKEDKVIQGSREQVLLSRPTLLEILANAKNRDKAIFE